MNPEREGSTMIIRRCALGAATALALLGAACTGTESGERTGGAAPPVMRTTTPVAGTIQPVLVNSELGLGPSRVAVAFLDGEGRVIDDLEVRASFSAPPSSGGASTDVVLEPLRIGEHSSHGGSAGSPLLTVYGATVDFPAPGNWSVLLRLIRGGAELQPIRADLSIVEDLPYPTVGEAIPPTRQTVLREVGQLSMIDTSPAPDELLHRLTVAEALELRRPLVIGFATPAFCETRMCGPVVEEVLRPLGERYGETIEVIHIEPFDVQRARAGELVPVPAMAEWGLKTEPWVFVVDSEGRVVARFEGPLTFAEVDRVLKSITVRG